MKTIALTHRHGFAAAALVITTTLIGPAVCADELPVLDCIIEPSETVDIGSAVPGVLEDIAFDSGDEIRRGEVIASLESGLERASVDLARLRASLDTSVRVRSTSAEFFARNQQRSRSLSDDHAISKQQLDQLETESRVADLQVQQERDNVRIARLELARAEQALKRRSIRSPLDGVVTERFKSVGEYVEDTPILRVARLDPLYVETIVPVELLGRIEQGMQAEVSPMVPGQAVQLATVSRIDRVADAASGTFGVRLTLDNPDGDIVSGVRCALDFLAAPREQVTRSENPQPATQGAASNDRDEPVNPVAATTVEPSKPQRAAAPDDTRPVSRHSCFVAGPLIDDADANRLLEALRKHGGEGFARQELEQNTKSGFFVMTPVLTGDAVKSLRARLSDAGIDDTHYLRRGPFRNRLSLGLYAKQLSASQRAEALAARGFDVAVVPRQSSQTWLEVNMPRSLVATEVELLLPPNSVAAVEAVPCASDGAFSAKAGTSQDSAISN